MNLKQALYIKTIVEEGGVAKAAKKLYVSQPSLSQTIRYIENELGVSLFDRTTHPAKLTYAGDRYLEVAKTLLNTYEALKNELTDISDGRRGRLRLGISIRRSAQVLSMALPVFAKKYPDVNIVLNEAGSAEVLEMLQSGIVDVALVTTEANNADVSYRLIEKETIGILAGKGSPLAARLSSGERIHITQAMDAPYVLLKPGHSIRQLLEQLIRESGKRPVVYMETDSMEAAQKIAGSCGCYTLCSNSMLDKDVCFYPLIDHSNARNFYACFRAGHHLPRFALDFLDILELLFQRTDSINP